MPAQPPEAGKRHQRRPRFPRHPPRAVLNAIMTLAVVVVERRIRKALRSGTRAGAAPARGD
jgi:hypothetical protein